MWNAICAACKWLVSWLPSFTIAKDGLKYLTRYYVFLKDREFGNIFIHHFHRSDMDMGTNGLGLLHNHPANWSFSFILSGGYWEERRESDGTVSKRLVKPWTFNFISRDTFHRVDLVDEKNGAWSIFFMGSRKSLTWGFWDRVTKQYIPFQQVDGAIE
jgi:hypothetical protein